MHHGCFAAEEDGKELKAYLYVHADVPLDLIALNENRNYLHLCASVF